MDDRSIAQPEGASALTDSREETSSDIAETHVAVRLSIERARAAAAEYDRRFREACREANPARLYSVN